jgi:hypothetical protein
VAPRSVCLGKGVALAKQRKHSLFMPHLAVHYRMNLAATSATVISRLHYAVLLDMLTSGYINVDKCNIVRNFAGMRPWRSLPLLNTRVAWFATLAVPYLASQSSCCLSLPEVTPRATLHRVKLCVKLTCACHSLKCEEVRVARIVEPAADFVIRCKQEET